MIANLPAIVTTVGLVCDIVGACLVAIEVVKVFSGSHSITLPGSGAYNGSARTVTNPEFEKYDRDKRKYMWAGLVFLFTGFFLQGLGTWLPIWYPAPATSAITQTVTIQPETPNLPSPLR